MYQAATAGRRAAPKMRSGRRRSAASPIATAGATVTGNLYLLLATIALATLSVLVSWIPPRGNWVFAVARLWGRGLLAASWLPLEVHGDDEIDRARSYVFMSNHRGLFDIPALLASLPVQTRFLAKRSLFRIPIFGWALSLGGFVNIDRQNPTTAGDSFSAAIGRLRQGVSLLVFPEGTRSASGELLPFKRGGFLLALKSGLPIVPVGITGSGEARRRGSLAIRPRPIRVHYGRPIEVRDYSVRDKESLMRAVRERIEELTVAPANEESESE